VSLKYPPLYWETRPSDEKFFIGLGSWCPYRRLKTICAKQLETRKSEALNEWPDLSHLREVVSYTSRQIKEWLEWPNDYFVPDDPCEILFCDPTAYGFAMTEHAEECLEAIQKHFSLPGRILDQLDLERIRYEVLINMIVSSGSEHGSSINGY